MEYTMSRKGDYYFLLLRAGDKPQVLTKEEFTSYKEIVVEDNKTTDRLTKLKKVKSVLIFGAGKGQKVKGAVPPAEAKKMVLFLRNKETINRLRRENASILRELEDEIKPLKNGRFYTNKEDYYLMYSKPKDSSVTDIDEVKKYYASRGKALPQKRVVNGRRLDVRISK